MFMGSLVAAVRGRRAGSAYPFPPLGVRRGCRRRCGVPALRAAAGALLLRLAIRVLGPVVDAVLEARRVEEWRRSEAAGVRRRAENELLRARCGAAQARAEAEARAEFADAPERMNVELAVLDAGRLARFREAVQYWREKQEAEERDLAPTDGQLGRRGRRLSQPDARGQR